LDFLGFSTWAESEAQVISKVSAKFEAYCAWRSRHGMPVSLADAGVEFVGRWRAGIACRIASP
jgi:hypothetical protein